MSQIVWIDGWVDGDHAQAEDGGRYRLPDRELGIKDGVRIQFTLRRKRRNCRPSVDKVLFRP